MKLGIFISLLLLLSSCWPTKFLSLKDDSMPEEWESFHIAPLEITSATAPNNYPAQLAEELRSGIQKNTRLKMKSTIDAADVKIYGTISNYSTSPIAVQQGDNASLNRLTITINYTIETPTKGLEKITYSSSRFADFDATQQLSDVESTLLESINQQLIQDLISKLQSNW